ncbi:hypothetical protein [Photorhabdus heterorhabditis]|uniref:Uncharacterized protein n=1 Tax=Photorhabdus heterorhabditis TaxID=880156 RepID=A0A5B0X8Q2_9GAMM|nr:hypothetical protein [Photorhabdus heterorhabditis]KAA1195770.1 hypothetical protein F0L16_01255 [Photorhabdus heterorhabditis]KOY62848.1 hypothetical protein AM629_06455 [Photorhabdus heterorhabditis]MBS9441225.1 hypothetical protein [Photorhabdus heterorhabditis]NRN29690.1 hypothetical protein [Photorhabdus heterorhabditis subsp. aluminescens]
MANIKQYRIEIKDSGKQQEANIFIREGEEVDGALPKEITVRRVMYPAGDLNKKEVLVDRFIRKLESNGFKKEV